MRQRQEVVGGKEAAEKRNKSFPSSLYRRLAFPILNATHLSHGFDKFTSMEIKLKTTIAKFSFLKEQVNQVLQKSKKKKQQQQQQQQNKKPGGIYMRLNDRTKPLLSFHLPVVDFRVLCGSSGKKSTRSFTTY